MYQNASVMHFFRSDIYLSIALSKMNDSALSEVSEQNISPIMTFFTNYKFICATPV